MSTLALATRGNIYDVQKFKNPNNGAILEVTNTIIERNDILKDLSAIPANAGLSHSGLRLDALPSGSLVDVGGTWGASKSTRSKFTEAIATIRDTYQAPKDTFATDSLEAGQALLNAEKQDHIEGMTQSWMNLILEGSTVPTQNGVVGLMKRAPYTTIDNKHTFSVGGTGDDLRSCWLMAPDINTVHLIYNPAHPTIGVEMQDKGEVYVVDPDDSTKHRWDIVIEFMQQQGICIRNQKAVKRICNVPCGTSDTPTAALVNAVINASIINAVSGKQWFLYCDERLYAQLVIGVNDKNFVYMSDKNIYHTSLPMIGTNIIIRRCDALNHEIGSGETVVS
ncbi:MAG: hypothetical protein PHQ00_00040 [Phycisphaerae bacterium]|nr:hypothetical protein [Phycisphaerae bacterium]